MVDQAACDHIVAAEAGLDFGQEFLRFTRQSQLSEHSARSLAKIADEVTPHVNPEEHWGLTWGKFNYCPVCGFKLELPK